jgi:hypothetical protein
MSIFWQYLEYLRDNKKMWMLPIFLCLFMAGVAIVFVESSAVSAFIYAMF